jgi:hypothetical protein
MPQSPNLPKEIEDAIDEFDESAMDWGWQEDQGCGNARDGSYARYVSARAALRTIIAAAIAAQRGE